MKFRLDQDSLGKSKFLQTHIMGHLQVEQLINITLQEIKPTKI